MTFVSDEQSDRRPLSTYVIDTVLTCLLLMAAIVTIWRTFNAM